MGRVARDPSLVLLPGDFLMHNFARNLRHDAGSPEKAAIRTMQLIAATLGRQYPNAQFAIALGNNDIPCGDYKSWGGSRYLAELARTWAHLVNRSGAAPGFAASFARGGYYTARLPVSGLRLIVLDTVLFSSRYRGSCDGGELAAASDELSWFSKTLRDTPLGVRNVVVMHIPPGFDAFTTDYLRGLLAWPFLQRRYNDELVAALREPRDRIAYAIAGHSHTFDVRLAGDVPVILLSSLSPIYGNNPAFYTLRVMPDGSLRDIDVYPFDLSTRAWLDYRSFDRTWSVNGVNAASLGQLHARLAETPRLRAIWDQQANGWPTDSNGSNDPWGSNWRAAWCAQDLLASDFAQCAGIDRKRRVLLIGGTVLLAAVVTSALAVVLRMRVAPRG
jgi:hypothetical protein